MSLLLSALFQSSTGADDRAFDTSSRIPFFGTGRRSLSGEIVTAETSATVSPYYACVRNISEDIGKIPTKILHFDESGARTEATFTNAFSLLGVQPNPEMTAITFKEVVTSYALQWGNGYAEIERNGRGEAIALWPIHPARVIIERDADGKIQYKIFQNFDFCGVFNRQVGESVTIAAEDMIHIKGLGGDGVCGFSVLKFAVESLGTAIAAQNYEGALMGNGATPGGFFQHPNTLSKEAQERFLDTYNERHQGNRNAGKTMILEEGMKWEKSGLPPKEAQFLELRKFQVVDICRWFRMPPSKVQELENSSFNTLEQENLNYVTDTLTPWAVRWEQEIDAKILNNDTNTFTVFNFNSLLRGDTKTRKDFYQTLFNMGAIQPNEIRELEEMNPVEGGDTSFVQLNLQTLEDAAEGNTDEANANQGTANTPGTSGTSGDNTDTNGNTESAETVAPVLTLDHLKTKKEMLSNFTPIVQKAVRTINRKEEKALSNAKAKHTDQKAITKWAEDFYPSQADYAVNALESVLMTCAGIYGSMDSDFFVMREKLEKSITYFYEVRRSSVIRGETRTYDNALTALVKGTLSIALRGTQ